MIMPGKLYRIKAENPSIYLNLEEMEHYAWQGLNPCRADGYILKDTVVMAVEEIKTEIFDNEICKILHNGGVYIILSEDLECMFS